jgi:sugar lactone lactonase YvrE
LVRSLPGQRFSERPHGLSIGPEGTIYVADDGLHCIHVLDPDGRPIRVIGSPGSPSETGYDPDDPVSHRRVASVRRGGPPFNRPTKPAVAPGGDLFVSDGYGNARVHRYSAAGELLDSWGGPGSSPGRFNLPHGIAVAPDGRVMVADRENDRIQIFWEDGEFLEAWTDVQRPTDLCVDGSGVVYVSELRRQTDEMSFTRGFPDRELPGRVSVFDAEGSLLARWGGPEPCAPGNFWAPHTICADSRGDVYVGDVAYSYLSLGARGLLPEGCPVLQKFARVGG